MGEVHDDYEPPEWRSPIDERDARACELLDRAELGPRLVDINPRTWRNHVARSSWGLTYLELRISVALLTREKDNELSPWATVAEIAAMMTRADGERPGLESALPELLRRGLVLQDRAGGMPYRWRATRRLANLLREGMGS